MTSESLTPCPSCSQSDAVRPARDAAAEPALAQQLAAPRGPRPHGKDLGCGTLLISSLVALTAGTLVGTVLMLLNARVATDDGGSVQETGIFSAILVFMVVFVAVYAAFVWRQARANALLNIQAGHYLSARDRYSRLRYCARCNGVFIPGQQRLVPPEQAQAFLYEPERRASVAQDPAGVSRGGSEGLRPSEK